MIVGEETPERRKSIAQPVTETKQDIEEEEKKSTQSDSRHLSVNQVSNSTGNKNKESSNDGNSTGGESALLVTMATNLIVGEDQRLDTQLDHVLQEFLLAKGSNHEIRQMFKECNLYQFEDFVECKVEEI